MRTLLLCVVGILAACGPQIVEPGAVVREPAPLMDRFSSYASVAEMRESLGRSIRFAIDRPRNPAEGRCPRCEEATLTIEEWTDRGVPGKAVLRFVNDRLFQVEFTPTDFTKYRLALDRAGVSIDHRPTRKSSKRILIWQTKRSRQDTIIWEDRWLGVEIDEWIMACS